MPGPHRRDALPILHDRLPFHLWTDPRLNRLLGILPLDRDDWLRVDEVYGPQMAERARLIATIPDKVHALLPEARAAAAELYAMIAQHLPGLGFQRHGGDWLCPDGRRVADDPAHPLLTLGHLVQEDLCLLQPGPDGSHRLTGAILCFPASWTLSQKIGRSLLDIHVPVPSYGPNIAARVQRLFDAIRPEQPLWRGNVLDYADPALYQPRLEGEARPAGEGKKAYIRSERQCLLRLPQSRAVVFSIHTYQVHRATLSPEAEAGFRARSHPA
ncbi:heme-dependent oxidative N-demethylase family protein [Pararhodobacter sp.]|uniref:heme-dependent oxidative N-demethylase family protein n=1 Tax=Pararhodobacter sp. TaxID=2127056 RepID=UPI002FDD0EF0